MFTFHWSELLVVALGGLALFAGIALLMLRRRNEILQQFLTPEEPELENIFFHEPAPQSVQEEAVAEEPVEEPQTEPHQEVQWGDADAGRHPPPAVKEELAEKPPEKTGTAGTE